MKFHEYQAKDILKDYQITVPDGFTINSVDEVDAKLASIDSNKYVVKAQVHTGGRGKAGGVKLVDNIEQIKEVANNLLGTNLVTYQTDAKGLPVNTLLIEEVYDISQELYLGLVLDRSEERISIIASCEGGVEIEKVAEKTPEKIITSTINPVTGFLPWQGRDIAFKLNLAPELIKQFVDLVSKLSKLFYEKDLSLIEINPLIITGNNQLVCLDAKLNSDDNANYRHPNLVSLFDESQEDSRELQAAHWDLNYVALDGKIGCMVNGAGLAMATMDIIKLYGSEPANFLDVGGTATAERVAAAFKIILSDSNVQGVLINIFGGIVRCDLIAEGILKAFDEADVQVPIVVRLEGNQAKKGLELLNQSNVNIVAEVDLKVAVQEIIKLTNK